MQAVTVDDVFRIVGAFGPFSRRHYFIVASSWIVCAGVTLLLVFAARSPGDWACASAPLSDAAMQRLTEAGVPCAGEGAPRQWLSDDLLDVSGAVCRTVPTALLPAVIAFKQPSHTVVATWHMVCGRDYLVAGMNSMYFVGFMVGVGVFGSYTDTKGRRKGYFMGLTVTVAGMAMTAAAGSVATFTLARVVSGVGVGGFSLAAYVLSTELVGRAWQSHCGTFEAGFFAVGVVLLSPIAYAVQPWRALSVLLLVAAAAFYGLYWWVAESPQWLWSQGDNDAAMAVLARVARGNGVVLPPSLRLTPAGGGPPDGTVVHAGVEARDLDAAVSGCCDDAAPGHHGVASAGGVGVDGGGGGSSSAESTTSPVVLLLRHPLLWPRTAAMVFTWCVASMAYYALSMNAGALGGSLYLTNALNGAVELPSYWVAAVLVHRAGRKSTFTWHMLAGALCCLASAATVQAFSVCDAAGGNCRLSAAGNGVNVALAMAGKFGVAAAFGVLYVWAAELFPTTVRSAGIGLSSLAARVGGIAAPLVLQLGTAHPAAPMYVVGLLSFAAAVVSLRPPETRGRTPPSSIAELERTGGRGVPAVVAGGGGGGGRGAAAARGFQLVPLNGLDTDNDTVTDTDGGVVPAYSDDGLDDGLHADDAFRVLQAHVDVAGGCSDADDGGDDDLGLEFCLDDSPPPAVGPQRRTPLQR